MVEQPAPPGEPQEPGAAGLPQLVVYWRPGCFFCNRLLRSFAKQGVVHERRNICGDDDARAFVAAHNGGDETVPTVALGADVRTNPDPRAYVERLRHDHPDLVRSPAPASGSILRFLGR